MRISWIGGFLLFIAVFVLSALHSSWIAGFLSLSALLILSATIRPLIRILFPDPFESLVLAFPAGYVLHGFLLSITARLFGIHRITIAIYIFASVLFCFLLTVRKFGAQTSLPAIDTNGASNQQKSDWDKQDVLLLFLWLFVTIAIVTLPFARVGEQTADGFAYRAYFNADFFRNMAISGALSSTGIPPDNPYLAGNTLHYYWFFHLLPAFWNQLIPSFRPDSLLVQFSLIAVLMFVATLFVVLRRFVQNRKTVLFLLPVFAFGGSYEGLYVLHWLKNRNMPWTEFVTLNIDGILRWTWKAPQIDTLYRALLYAPQHLIALSILLIALLVWNSQRLGKDVLNGSGRKTLFYLLIFSSLGFSAFIGSTLILGAGLIIAWQTIVNPRKNWPELVFSGILGLIFLGVYFFSFQMFQAGSQKFDLGPDKIILAHFFSYFLLNWGALLILGIAGVFYRSPLLPNRILLFFLVFCFALIFFTRIMLAGFSDISLKIGHFSHVILLLLAAGAIDRFLTRFPEKARLMFGCILILVLPALVTWGMDFWNSIDIHNRRFTTYVSPQEAEVTNWMQRNVPSKTVVLNYSPKYDDFMRDIVPPFSERSVFLGDRIFSRIFQVSEEQVRERETTVSAIFRSSEPKATWDLTRKAGIEYVFVTDVETPKVPLLLQKFAPPYFSLLIQDGRAALFRVNALE